MAVERHVTPETEAQDAGRGDRRSGTIPAATEHIVSEVAYCLVTCRMGQQALGNVDRLPDAGIPVTVSLPGIPVSVRAARQFVRDMVTLALDTLYHEWAAVPPARDTGSLRGGLLSLLRPWARIASKRPYGRVIAALITEAQTDPAFGGRRGRRGGRARPRSSRDLPPGDRPRRDPRGHHGGDR